MEIKDELTLVIFTHEGYYKMLPTVLEGVKNIQDNIVKRYIVSPTKIDVPGYTHLSDSGLWRVLDPNFRHRILYQKKWYRQQILKLCIDLVKGIEGNILILDGDVVITQPMKFIENNKINYYMAGEYNKAYFTCNEKLIGLNKVRPDSFISEAMVFRPEVLDSLKHYIQDYNKSKDWLSVIEEVAYESITKRTFTDVCLSEFELYGSYATEWYSDTINKYIPPYQHKNYQPRMTVTGWQDMLPEELYNSIRERCPHVLQSVLFV